MDNPLLPAHMGVAEFDQLHDNPSAWRSWVEALARQHAGPGHWPLVQMDSGTVLVALLGAKQVLKLYPPFLRDHHAYECAMLVRVGGRLTVPTPVLLKSGEHQGWPWLLMTQLQGQLLTEQWPQLDERARCALLHSLGALAAEVHALPVMDAAGERAAGLPQQPVWADFLARQRAACYARQQHTGLPMHLLAQLPAFLEGPLPSGPAVMLTGEYTPMNLLADQGRLCGMFDFGDGLLGPREYDWLGPLAFLAAGDAGRCAAFFDGYGVTPDVTQRQALMRLLL
jgi:hygromycin-B 7''-O-kinase